MAFWPALALLAAIGSVDSAGIQPPITQAPPAKPEPDAAFKAQVEQSVDLIRTGCSADALPILDQAIAGFDKLYADEKRQIFCARSPQEMILYAAMGTQKKTDTVVLGYDWALAIFLKGFALVDVGRGDEAKPLFDRAIALSPMNGQFLAEEGEWYKTHKDWPTAYSLFERASTAADLKAPDTDHFEKRRALRGMGYALSEQRRFNEAEKMYRECLKLYPGDKVAAGELEYTREQRAKGGSSS